MTAVRNAVAAALIVAAVAGFMAACVTWPTVMVPILAVVLIGQLVGTPVACYLLATT